MVLKVHGILSKRHKSNCHLEKLLSLFLLTPDCNAIIRITIHADKFLMFEKVCLTLTGSDVNPQIGQSSCRELPQLLLITHLRIPA